MNDQDLGGEANNGGAGEVNSAGVDGEGGEEDGSGVTDPGLSIKDKRKQRYSGVVVADPGLVEGAGDGS